MICIQCGWDINDHEDCYCSGCARLIRKLAVIDKKESYTFFFQSDAELVIPLKNLGDKDLEVENWEFDKIKGLSAAIDGTVQPSVAFLPGDKKELRITCHGSSTPNYQIGNIRIESGISPPLVIPITCSPLPVIYFYINNRLIRESHIQIITDSSNEPDLQFKIEVTEAPHAVLTDFVLYPGKNRDRVFPIPSNIELPSEINSGRPLEFSLKPDMSPFHSDSGTCLVADFVFENIPPESHTIEIIQAAKIVHEQSAYLIDDAAIVAGSKTPHYIDIKLKNSGGILAKIIQIKSKSEHWLTIESLPNEKVLEPKGASNCSFNICIDPQKIPVESTNLNGKILITYTQGDRQDQFFEKTIYIGVQVDSAETLRNAIAIDFGNNGTCVSYFTLENQLKTIALDPIFENVYEFPTIIEFNKFANSRDDENGKGFRYGCLLEKTKYAKGNSFRHRVWSFKRKIGIPEAKITKIDIENKKSRELSIDEITGYYFTEILARFKEYSGNIPKEVILTYPASYKQSQIDQLKTIVSGISPELRVFANISEPEAIALNYFRDHPLDDKSNLLFAVFDFGGGTTDISIGSVKKNNISILLSIGLDQLGGDTLTFALAKTIYEKVLETFEGGEYLFPSVYEDIFRISLAEEKKLYNFMSLMRIAEDLKTNKDNQLDKLFDKKKISLNIQEFYQNSDSPPDFCHDIPFTLEEFNNSAGKMIRKGLTKIKGMMAHLNKNNIIKKKNLDLIILGGNSSRLPSVKQLSKEVLKLNEDKIYFSPENAKIAVAKGAAFYGRLRKNPKRKLSFDNKPRLKYPIGKLDCNDQFEVLFAAGSLIGDDSKVIKDELLVSPDTELEIFWNEDPSVKICHAGSECVREAAVYSLSKFYENFDEEADFTLQLVHDGIKISKVKTGQDDSKNNDSKSDIIKIDW